MDVSKQAGKENELSGLELMETVVSATGLPEDPVQAELTKILAVAGCAPENLTIDELRAALLGYLETLQEEIIPAEHAASEQSDHGSDGVDAPQLDANTQLD
jgi:hypothetical protein